MIVRIVWVLLISLILSSCSQLWHAGVGRIQGTLFWDKNKNGLRDPGEVGLPNRKIYLYGLSDDSTRTDSLGNYVFSNLAEGNYLVAQEIRTSWLHSYPRSGMYAAQRRRAVNVGVFRQLCRIAADIRDVPKPAGWRMKYVVPARLQEDSSGNYGRQGASINDLTIFGIGAGGNVAMLVPHVDSLGLFSVDNVASPLNWGGAGTWILSIGPQNPVHAHIDFGAFAAEISGKVLLNARDSTAGLAGWKVLLHGPSTMTALTDSAGRYEFSDFEWGRYTITLESRDGFEQTTPATISTPSEPWIAVRSRIQSRIAEIYRRATSYHENYSKRETSFNGFAIPPELSADSLASYDLLKATRDTLICRATLRAGEGSIVLNVVLSDLIYALTESGDLVASARSAPGTWFVDDPIPYTYDPVFNWMDFGVVRRGTIAGRVSEAGAGSMLYFAGATLDSSATDRDGKFVSKELGAGAYIVSCERDAGSGSHAADTRASALRRRTLREDLNQCAHLLSLIAVDASRYKTLFSSEGGGGGGYWMYRVPPVLAGTAVALAEAQYVPPSLNLTVESVKGLGRISACLDYGGFLRDVKIDGRFAELQAKVIYTDLFDPHIIRTNF